MKILEKVLGVKAEKKAYRDYKRRVEALPTEYNIVMKEMQHYLWNYAGALDGSLELLYDMLALFEAGAAEGKRVLDITGPDVAGFCDNLVREYQGKTYIDKGREKLNANVQKKLEEVRHDGD
jgi:DNA-binding ferritin-like protein (Dps family)